MQGTPAHIREMVKNRLVHEVHTSERRSFRGCRRRWDWVFRQYYYPKTTAKPLEFGVAFHAAMEVLYNPDTWKWDRKTVLALATKVFVDMCEEQRTNYLKERDEQYISEEEVQADYDERVELGKGMLRYYIKDVASKYDHGWTPLKVEVEFVVPIQNPDTGEFLFCTCATCRRTQQDFLENDLDIREAIGPGVKVEWAERNYNGAQWWYRLVQDNGAAYDWEPFLGLVVALAGRIDLLAEDKHGYLWIVDWKTAARLSRGDSSGQDRDEFLELDDQIGSYVMALRRKLGLNVRGFVYVELKKAFPEPPQRNVNIRQGRMFSVNRQQSVDHATYLKTVSEQDPQAYQAGLYEEFLDYLKNEGINFHGRYQLVKTDEELEEIERNLWHEAADMVDQNLRIYPNAGRFNCSFCAFRQPCLEKNRQGDYEYMLDNLYEKRTKHYWVKQLSTDKRGGE